MIDVWKMNEDGNANHKRARLTDMLKWLFLDQTKKMPIWRHEIVLKFQYRNSTRILLCHQLLILTLLWRNLHIFLSYSIHSHTRSLLLRGLCYCFTMHRDTGRCAFVFLVNIGPKAVRVVQICIADANETCLWYL